MVEDEVQTFVDAVGKTTRSLECFFVVGVDTYVATDFIRVGSYIGTERCNASKKISKLRGNIVG